MVPQAGRIDPGTLGKDVAQITLGIRTGCAECHNHPFDRWTMDDYYSWTSFFTGIQRKRGREGREMLISVDVDAQPAAHLIDGRLMPHRFLGGDAPDVTDRDARREGKLADIEGKHAVSPQHGQSYLASFFRTRHR